MFRELIGLISKVAQNSVKDATKLRNGLLYLLATPIILMFIRWLFGSWKLSVFLGLCAIAWSVDILFRVRRIILYTAVGESGDATNMTGDAEVPGISNVVVETYLKYAFMVFLFCILMHTTIPFIPFENFFWAIIVLPISVGMMVLALGLGSFKFVQAVTIIGIFLVGSTMTFFTLCATIPQMRLYFNVDGALSYMATTEQAKGMNALNETTNALRDEAIAKDLKTVSDWRIAHPTERVPRLYEEFLAGVKNGDKKTLAEVQEELDKKKGEEQLKTYGEKTQALRDEAIAKDLKTVTDWRVAHPTEKEPELYVRFLQGVRSGNKKTLAEIQKELDQEKIEKDRIEAEVKKAEDERLKAEAERKKQEEAEKKARTVEVTLADPEVDGYKYYYAVPSLDAGTYDIIFPEGVQFFRVPSSGGSLFVNNRLVEKMPAFSFPKGKILCGLESPQMIGFHLDQQAEKIPTIKAVMVRK